MSHPNILLRHLDTLRLRHVKKEIRVLGLAGRQDSRGITLVGVVYRGNKWLDGVLRGFSDSVDVTDSLSSMVNSSIHSGQLRVIIIDRSDLPRDSVIDVDRLAAETGKAVILFGNWGEASHKSEDGTKFTFIGLSKWVADRVLKASSLESGLPEAVRVARLIIRALPRDDA